MADVRSLLKNERAARRIQHKHASYSATGSLLCLVCRLQLKSESLWEGHLRSPGHVMKAAKAEEQRDTAAATSETQPAEGNKKRKASDDDEHIRKRTKAVDGVPEGFFDAVQEPVEARPALPSPTLPSPTNEIQMPSRPATPSKPIAQIPKRADVDEDEWAAFEADIAAADAQVVNEDAVISAPAMSAAELAQKSIEETNAQRKERAEAELEGDKEDAARKMEEELDEMESLEQRVRKLREKREELRKKESLIGLNRPQTSIVAAPEPIEEDDDEDYDEDDDWMGLR